MYHDHQVELFQSNASRPEYSCGDAECEARGRVSSYLRGILIVGALGVAAVGAMECYASFMAPYRAQRVHERLSAMETDRSPIRAAPGVDAICAQMLGSTPARVTRHPNSLQVSYSPKEINPLKALGPKSRTLIDYLPYGDVDVIESVAADGATTRQSIEEIDMGERIRLGQHYASILGSAASKLR
jgi:hypothetical protein